MMQSFLQCAGIDPDSGEAIRESIPDLPLGHGRAASGEHNQAIHRWGRRNFGRSADQAMERQY